MAIAFVQSTGKGSTTGLGTTLTTDAITTTSSNFIGIGVEIFTNSALTITISDSKSNTYALAGGVYSGGNVGNLWIYYAYNITGGASHTFTVSFSGAAKTCGIIAYECSGLGNGDPFDKTAGAESRSASPVSSGNTATTTAADELIFGIGSNQSGALSTGSGFSNGVSVHNSAATDDIWLAAESKIVSSTGTYDAQFTIASFINASVVVATFKNVSTTVPLPYRTLLGVGI